MSRDRRKMLTAKIASDDWDGIIVAQSSFERIGMSRGYREKFLTEQIAEYDQLIREHAADRGANRNLIKTIEKQKAARVEHLKDLLAENKKDDGLVHSSLPPVSMPGNFSSVIPARLTSQGKSVVTPLAFRHSS